MYFVLRRIALGLLMFSSVIAQPAPVITLENAQQLKPLGSVRTPISGALTWSADGRWLAAAASTGLSIIDTTDSNRVVQVLPDIKTEALFGADGLTFTAERRLYNTLSGEIMMGNGVRWADEAHQIVYANETPNTTTLYRIADGELGERIVTIPFAADRVIVPPASPLLNGVFIRDIDESSLEGEVTVWYWGESLASQEEYSTSAQMIYASAFYDEPIVSISPDGLIAAIKVFPMDDVLISYGDEEILCECYEMLGFIKTEGINLTETTRFVVMSSSYSMYGTPAVLDMEWGRGLVAWHLPAMPMAKDSGRASTWDFTDSYQFGAISAERGVEIWRLDTTVPAQIAQIEGEVVHAISEDGRRVLTSGSDGLIVWSLDNLSVPRSVKISATQPVLTATFDRNNANMLLINHREGGYQVWNELSDGAWAAGAQNIESGNYDFAANGRFVVKTTGYPPSVSGIFDSRTGDSVVDRPGAFAVSPNGGALAFWDGAVLRIIDAATLLSRDVLTLQGVDGEFSTVNLPLDQAYIIDSAKTALDVYTIQTGEYRFSIPLEAFSSYFFQPSFSADGNRIVFAENAHAPSVWDVSGVHPVLMGEVGEAFSYVTHLNDDGTLLALHRPLTDEEREGLPDSTFPPEIIEVRDVESGTITHSIQTLRDPRPAFVPGTDLLLIQARTSIEVWDIAAQPAVRQGHFSVDINSSFFTISMTSVSFNAERTLALATVEADGYGGAFLIPLNLQTQDVLPLTSLQVSMQRIKNRPQFSANETYVVMSAINYESAPKVIVYRLSDGASIALSGQVGVMNSDETLLVTANPLRLWNVAELFIDDTPQPIAEYPEENIDHMTFSEDGTLLYTWGSEGVTVWHAGDPR